MTKSTKKLAMNFYWWCFVMFVMFLTEKEAILSVQRLCITPQ